MSDEGIDKEFLKSLTNREKKVLCQKLGVSFEELEGGEFNLSKLNVDVSLERLKSLQANMLKRIDDKKEDD
ncbi:hypothetical protein [Pseudoteredinibacter isoporae]|uniref:hypothetical protein n=1 Tax=Pseudoteredinibacter isoporae TaxID=570281 RepID=UPI00310661A1